MTLKLKKIIAKEGLILLGITTILLLRFVFGLGYKFVFPEYKAIFLNGETYRFTVYPPTQFEHKNLREYIQEVHNPSLETIQENLNKIIERENIASMCQELTHIESKSEDIAYIYGIFFSLNMFFKIIIIYSILLFIRFPVWAIKMLTIKK